MSSSMPMRVDGDLFDAAKSVGAVGSRSAAHQFNFNHWARIGRELEAAPSTSLRDIERGQAIVRASWDEQVSERLASLDLAAEFTQAGRS